ncbi:uncharacterized protein LACBIDRAFT_314451 [Laccaria bicolor S238N-H82]|uniref:Predicted protein n=1 Tax=Laccaria bicolor (strain S238N-H82 / ATCC MYA-4686) TaxID=486041 RepID=B0DYL0_LACBS|nr:uncharacterized protein LACBIDRAFT_314451 [Laccaria bicolor S238N-H82]EDR00263.1 predicted protein [Laccaria bicolor S238N-H82]|eukprot:XP_001889015.1 predicted protein [Laccaria bicolor S238N-H82]
MMPFKTIKGNDGVWVFHHSYSSYQLLDLQKTSCSLIPSPLSLEFLLQDAPARRASAPAAPAGPPLLTRQDVEAQPAIAPTARASLRNASAKWTEYSTRSGHPKAWLEEFS